MHNALRIFFIQASLIILSYVTLINCSASFDDKKHTGLSQNWKIEGLIAALKSPSPQIRGEAVGYIAFNHYLPAALTVHGMPKTIHPDSSTMVWRSEKFKVEMVADLLDDYPLSTAAVLGYIGKDAAKWAPMAMKRLNEADLKAASRPTILLRLAMSNPAIVPAIAESLSDKEDCLRVREAIEVLSKVGKPGVPYIPQILKLFDDSPYITFTSDEHAFNYVCNKTFFIRYHVLTAMGEFGELAKDHIPAFAKLLDDTSSSVRAHCAESLVKMGREALPYLIDTVNLSFKWEKGSAFKGSENTINSTYSIILQHIVNSYPEQLYMVAALLKSNCPQTRYAALDALEVAGKPGAQYISQVSALLNDEQRLVRNKAMETLGALGALDTAAVKIIAEYLSYPSSKVQIKAIAALSSSGHNARIVLPRLVFMLKDKSKDNTTITPVRNRFYDGGRGIHDVRSAALATIAELGEGASEYTSDIAKLLNDDKAHIRAAAVTTLGSMGSAAKEHFPEIAGLLGDSNIFVRCRAAEAFRELGPQARDYIPQIAALLSDSVAVFSAIGALTAMGDLAVEYWPRIITELEASDKMQRHVKNHFFNSISFCDLRSSPHVFDKLIGSMSSDDHKFNALVSSIWKNIPIDPELFCSVVSQLPSFTFDFLCNKGESDFVLICTILNAAGYCEHNNSYYRLLAHVTSGSNQEHHEFIYLMSSKDHIEHNFSSENLAKTVSLLRKGWNCAKSHNLEDLKDDIAEIVQIAASKGKLSRKDRQAFSGS